MVLLDSKHLSLLRFWPAAVPILLGPEPPLVAASGLAVASLLKTLKHNTCRRLPLTRIRVKLAGELLRFRRNSKEANDVRMDGKTLYRKLIVANSRSMTKLL